MRRWSAPRSCRTPRVRGQQPENRQPLVDESLLGEHGDRKAARAELLEKDAGLAEGRQQQECRAAGFEVIAQARGEAFCYIGRAPGAVTVVPRRAAQKWRVEQDQVEALPRDGCEQIAVPHLDAVLD